jgi:hypothetical protein
VTRPRGALPTLTEVIDVGPDSVVPQAGPTALPPESIPIETPYRAPPQRPTPVDAALHAKALAALQPRIDALIEARLHVAMAPLLARVADEVAQRLRGEIAGDLPALVAQAIDEALALRRKP